MKGILLTDGYELDIEVLRDDIGKIVQGLKIGNIDAQRVRMIVEAQKGEFKEYPTLGFGVQTYLKSPSTIRQRFIAELNKELKTDNIKADVTLHGDGFESFSVNVK
jgi:hypothetical protein